MSTNTDAVRWGHGDARDGRVKPVAGLVLLHAPDLDRLPSCVVLPEAGLVVGRSPPPGGLCIPHGAVSKLHARILPRESGWALKDLGSRNGTLLNGRLHTEAHLQPLDELRFGDAILKFVACDADRYVPYRIDGTGPESDPGIVGGYQVRAVLRELEAIAATPLSIVLHGETGTGKELFAQALHRMSARRGRLVALNCAAIPSPLFESEMFGFKRGAFTGADQDKIGLVRAADRGTLFLDEVGDLPPDGQAKLLRVLETREVTPVGATSGVHVDVRFVCATHRDLEELVEAGRFRGDLLARLRGALVRLPPLRERKEDLYALVKSFARGAGAPEVELGMSFMAGLIEWDWPYNVRELEAAVRRALAVARGEALSGNHLPDALRENMRDYGSPASPAPRSHGPSSDELRAALDRHKGNVAAVAREFGRDRTQIQRWMRYAGIDPATFRG